MKIFKYLNIKYWLLRHDLYIIRRKINYLLKVQECQIYKNISKLLESYKKDSNINLEINMMYNVNDKIVIFIASSANGSFISKNPKYIECKEYNKTYKFVANYNGDLINNLINELNKIDLRKLPKLNLTNCIGVEDRDIRFRFCTFRTLFESFYADVDCITDDLKKYK